MVVLVTTAKIWKNPASQPQTLATNGVVVFTIGVGTPTGKEVVTLKPPADGGAS